jgi:ATP-dependent Clp protease adaptor protein ClpS
MDFSQDIDLINGFSFAEQAQEQTDVAVLLEEETSLGHQLVVYNDDVNSFEYVIITLIEVCEHTAEQAEQCTLMIHFRGKCGVKSGQYEDLLSMRNEICRRGISAEIESVDI